MKKVLSILLAAVMVLGVFSFNIPVSKASGDLSFEFTANPSSMTTGGKVTFTVQVTNNLTDNVYDVLLQYGSNIISVGNIDAKSESDPAVKTFNIPTSMLDKNITFNVTYTVEGETASRSMTASTKVKKDVPEAKVNFKCNVDRTAAPKSGEINFTFIVQNIGDAPLSDISVTLPEIGSKKLNTKFTTMAAGVTHTFVYTYTIKSDITVTPTLKYTANGETKTQKLATKSLVIAEPGLDLSISADNENPTAGEDVTFTLSIKNTGNAKLSNIKAFNHAQEQIKLSATTLLPGAKITVKNLKYTFDQTTKVQFSATAEDTDGQTYNYTSNDVSISMPIDKTKVGMDIQAVADNTELTAPGKVKFKITVSNTGSYPIYSLVVTEDKLGQIGTADSLEASTPTVFEKEVDVSESGTYTFKVTAKDADGNTYNKEASPIQIKYTEPAATVTGTAAATDAPAETKGAAKGDTLGTIIIIMVIVIVLIIAVVVALIVLVNKEKRSQARSRKLPPAAKPKAIKYRNKNNF